MARQLVDYAVRSVTVTDPEWAPLLVGNQVGADAVQGSWCSAGVSCMFNHVAQPWFSPCTLLSLQICGKFVPANSTLMLSTFMGQVVTDPHLKLGTPSKEEFERLEASWAGINAAVLRDEFKPERWLEDTSRPSGLLTFRYDEAHY